MAAQQVAGRQRAGDALDQLFQRQRAGAVEVEVVFGVGDLQAVAVDVPAAARDARAGHRVDLELHVARQAVDRLVHQQLAVLGRVAVEERDAHCPAAILDVSNVYLLARVGGSRSPARAA